MNGTKDPIIGPKRVLPGRLSVSRTFGDPEAKIPTLGGKIGVITAVPEIRSFKISPNFDYIILGSDGIFDKLSNKDIVQCVVNTLNDSILSKNVHEVCGAAVECVVKNALMRKSLDNVTVVMVAFKHFKQHVKQKLGMNRTYAAPAKDTSIEHGKKLSGLICSSTRHNAGHFDGISKKPITDNKAKNSDSRNSETTFKRVSKTESQLNGSADHSGKRLLNPKLKSSFK